MQDAIGTVQLACETDPKHEIPVLDCRRMMLIFNQFLHLHQKDFVPDGKNVKLLAEACEGTSNDPATWSEQTLEIAFNKIDKKQLDKKIFNRMGRESYRVVNHLGIFNWIGARAPTLITYCELRTLEYPAPNGITPNNDQS